MSPVETKLAYVLGRGKYKKIPSMKSSSHPYVVVDYVLYAWEWDSCLLECDLCPTGTKERT